MKPMYCKDCHRQVVAILEDGESGGTHEDHAEGCEALATGVCTLAEAVPA